MSDVALGLLEFDSIAAGIVAGDAMVKRSPVDTIRAGTVQPGRYLVMLCGEVAEVQEALEAGRAAGGSVLRDELFLPQVDRAVVLAIGGTRRTSAGQALGIVETQTAAACIRGADAGVKGATVVLRELRLSDGLGGKGFVFFGGDVADVEAAVEAACRAVGRTELLINRAVIASLHGEMDENLRGDTRFGMRTRGEASW